MDEPTILNSARWASATIRKIMVGAPYTVPSTAPAYATDLLSCAGMAISMQMPLERRRELANSPLMNKRVIAAAIHLADKGHRVVPSGTHPVVGNVAVPYTSMSVPLPLSWWCNLLADSFYAIAKIGYRPVGQRDRQRRADRRNVGAGPEIVTVPNNRRMGDAQTTMMLGEQRWIGALRGPMASVARAAKRIARREGRDQSQ